MSWYSLAKNGAPTFMDPVAQKIYASLNALGRELCEQDVSNVVWTSRFKENLCNIGRQQVDVCWAKTKCLNNMEFCGLALACEIEWQTEDAAHLDDFWKLTVVEADLRLFVFSTKRKPNETELERQFKLLRDNSEYSPGKRYLAIMVSAGWREDFPYCEWITGD